MRQEREVEMLIDNDGNFTIEAIGFQGVGCHEVLEKYVKAMGILVKDTQKPEYTQKVSVANQQRIKQ